MASDRYLDLLQQGFMRGGARSKPKKAPPPTVSCYDCLNWHPKGKHISPPEVRRERRRARQLAGDKGPAQRPIGERKHQA